MVGPGSDDAVLRHFVSLILEVYMPEKLPLSFARSNNWFEQQVTGAAHRPTGMIVQSDHHAGRLIRSEIQLEYSGLTTFIFLPFLDIDPELFPENLEAHVFVTLVLLNVLPDRVRRD